MVFQFSQNDDKSPLVFRTLLSILAGLNNAVVWVGTIPAPISNASSPFLLLLSLLFLASFSHQLTGGLSLESEWQQVSSNFQDFSQYLDRS